MKRNVGFLTLLALLLVFTIGASAEENLESRIAKLESRIEALENELERMRVAVVPPVVGQTYEIDGFVFNRLNLRQSSSITAQLVGEVSSDRDRGSVRFRATFYDESGAILSTDTFRVDQIGPTPRTFQLTVIQLQAANVHTYQFQVE